MIKIILIALILWLIFTYNRLVKQENRVQEAWSGIDVQLKLRHNLIPNLVEVVKGYADYEKDTLIKVIEQRASTPNDINNKEANLTKSLKTIFALAESYPQLKADSNFLELQKNLITVEDQLQYARRYYNGSVRDYNTLIQIFPNNILASVIKKEEKQFFEIERSIEGENPDVNLT